MAILKIKKLNGKIDSVSGLLDIEPKFFKGEIPSNEQASLKLDILKKEKPMQFQLYLQPDEEKFVLDFLKEREKYLKAGKKSVR